MSGTGQTRGPAVFTLEDAGFERAAPVEPEPGAEPAAAAGPAPEQSPGQTAAPSAMPLAEPGPSRETAAEPEQAPFATAAPARESSRRQTRAPAAFSLSDPSLKMDAPLDEPSLALTAASAPLRPGSRGWGAVFWSAVSGLVVLGLLLWAQQTVMALLQRSGWLGWTATLLFAIAGFAFVMIAGREIAALLRLSAITALRRRAAAALLSEDVREARASASEMLAMFKGRRELAPGAERLKRHQRGILDAHQVLTLAERELLLPLDKRARAAIGASGRRVSVVTAMSPAVIVPVAFVAYENFRMLRNLAEIYGGRPGFFAILRLLRLIAAHLAVAGGIAFTDDIVQQFIGHGLTARLSRRLGEGLVNGGFTIRIGIAALEVVRPLPYVEARQPRLREFMAEFLKIGKRAG